MTNQHMPRRRFLALTMGGLSAVAIAAACGDDDDDSAATPSATSGATSPAASGTPPEGRQAQKGTVLVGDVLDHALSDDRWTGEFGFVTFALQTGVVNAERVYFIRTDASDEAFASTERLVHVPLMANAAADGRGIADIFLFTGGSPDQLPVLSTAPHEANYTPAFRVNRVIFNAEPELLDSVRAIEAAEEGGALRIERTDIIVNYPVVKWPGGELPVDGERTAYLGAGQLIEPVDVEGGTVTFKLHTCYPGSRYIVTDVTIAEMAEGMNIAAAPGAAALTDAGATAKILVFGNGLEGSGPMGFQKSITDTSPGDAAWSPYWDHFTFTWNDEGAASLLTSEEDVLDHESQGDLTRHPGTPDTNGTLFMVNCPVPVVAPVA